MKDPLRALQRHFEEQYGSLDIPKSKSKKRKRGHVEPEPEKEQVSESEEEWQGIQDTSVSVGPTVESRVESRVEPVVVEFRETGEGLEEPEVVSKKKDFMSSRLPKAASAISKAQSGPQETESPNEEALNLQNDIALQRLLRESNLLSEYASKEDPGRLRHLTLDARISHLGGKEANKGNVPLRIRKGIQNAKKQREEKKEKEAREAGIVMATKQKQKIQKTRQRGLKTTAGVGKFKNGMLKINERDIRRINNSGSKSGRRGKSIKKLFK